MREVFCSNLNLPTTEVISVQLMMNCWWLISFMWWALSLGNHNLHLELFVLVVIYLPTHQLYLQSSPVAENDWTVCFNSVCTIILEEPLMSVCWCNGILFNFCQEKKEKKRAVDVDATHHHFCKLMIFYYWTHVHMKNGPCLSVALVISR